MKRLQGLRITVHDKREIKLQLANANEMYK